MEPSKTFSSGAIACDTALFSKARCVTLVNRAWSLRWRNPELSWKTAELAYRTFKQQGREENAPVLGKAARVLGWHMRWTGEFDAAKQYFLEAEALLIHEEDKSQRIEAMAGRAVVLYSQGSQDSASELTRRALFLLGPEGSVSTRVDLFLVQATILSYSRAFEDALDLVEDAILLAEQTGAYAELSQAFHIRARIYLRMDRVADASKPARQALRIAKASRSAVMLPYAIEVLAAVELELGRFKRSAWLARKAAKLGEAQRDRRVTCQSLVVLGKALNAAGEQAEALKIHERGLQVATEISYPLWQRWFQLEIANIMEARGDFHAALPAYKAYIEMDQELFRKETETRMAEMRTKFDLQRAQENAELERARAEELAKAREVAETAARTDQLTGIANRTGLENYIEATKASSQPFAYIVIDVNRFKPINDRYGHVAGDAVLIEIASRLKQASRKGDLAARTGGDEFALIVQGISTRAQAAALGKRLLSAFEAPAHLRGTPIEISTSIGIAISDIIGRDWDQLMTCADQAMYAAKRMHEPAFHVYDIVCPQDGPHINRASVVRSAIAEGEIQPWFQPKINLRTGAMEGFETLARWVKPEGEIIPPGAFISEIEQHRLGREFTFAMLRRTLAQMADWQKHGLDVPGVAVNVFEEVLASHSGRQMLDDILGEHPEFRPLITFEITEDVFFDRAADEIKASIQYLGNGGTRFAMDDFGTGFGSFTHLHQLQIDELKIDITFVHGIGIDRSAEVIIEGFIYIAKGLNLSVIAEGIETQEQADFLLARGCEIGQGFLFSPAIAPEDTIGYITRVQRPRSIKDRTVY